MIKNTTTRITSTVVLTGELEDGEFVDKSEGFKLSIYLATMKKRFETG